MRKHAAVSAGSLILSTLLAGAAYAQAAKKEVTGVVRDRIWVLAEETAP